MTAQARAVADRLRGHIARETTAVGDRVRLEGPPTSRGIVAEVLPTAIVVRWFNDRGDGEGWVETGRGTLYWLPLDIHTGAIADRLQRDFGEPPVRA